jgi:hypothetical protein
MQNGIAALFGDEPNKQLSRITHRIDVDLESTIFGLARDLFFRGVTGS